MKWRYLREIRAVLVLLGCVTVMLMACQASRLEPKFNEPVVTFVDVPVAYLHEQTERYLGTVFEDKFMFDGFYPANGAANPVKQKPGEAKPYFAARPIAQRTDVIQIRISPGQDELVRKQAKEERNYVVKARIRFAGIAPGGQPAFDLIEILE